jgi:hypothetical protein
MRSRLLAWYLKISSECAAAHLTSIYALHFSASISIVQNPYTRPDPYVTSSLLDLL